ncbi:probable long-chain-alcohol O-fatty-acyltransferase 5 [Salvia miltiorrhiza]|uniref:probable long-chain-alcohol O-fatty-acyltransferase 5 n=1 Tax=Salvia miltiorrhiza TaxID=226208 RepID=UPI0025ABF0A0|nr:probable long-chain-alcohol O-fatty-acyltransferase 5 [Salvia miltiorrhiza]
MEEEIKNVSCVWLAVIGAFCYCRLVSSRLSIPKWRLISIAPVLCLLAVAPLCIRSSAFITALTAFFITWLATFKLLLFAFDLGPLASNPPKSLPVFVALAALPFRLKPPATAKKSKKLPLNLATEIPISAVLISALFEYKEKMHPFLVLVAYCCLVFLMIEILVEMSSKLVRAVVGMELEPPSDEPYLSASLQEFWGRRWNLTVNSILREAVFGPVRRATAGAVGGETAALMGVLASFVVSGLMHELLFWYVAPGTPPSWEMTMFFVLHGVCVVAEIGIKKRLGKRKWRLPWFVTGPLTVCFVMGTSFWLFFPPVMRTGADVRVIEELRFAGELFIAKIKELWLHSCNKFT